MRKLQKPRQITFPAGLFLPLMILCCELLLHRWITEDLQTGVLASIAGFSLGFGGLLGLLTAFLPRRARKPAALLLGFGLGVFYLVEFFLAETYQTFMTPGTIVAGAGGIAQDYLALTLRMIGRNLERIALVLLPFIAYGLFAREPDLGWKSRCGLALGCAACYLAGFWALTGFTVNAGLLKDTYNFDAAVRSLGLNMGLSLEAIQSLQPEEAPDFMVEEPAPTESQPEATEPAVEYGYNVLPVDFGVAAEATGQGSIASIHRYVDSLEPSRQNEFTGMFRGKNLILITAEAFSAQVIDPELTPTLYRMATQGIRFTEYYQPAWGASTTTGEFSNLTGLIPTQGGSSMSEVYEQKLFMTMGHQLQKLDYYTVAYHNHLKDFYSRNKTHPRLGYEKFIARYGGLEISDYWPESDQEMIDLTVPDFIDRQPFHVYYMTVSGHCEYTQKYNDMTARHWDKVQHLDYSDIVKGYLAANLELEYAMESLIRQLEEAGIADDTLIVIATDHYPYGLERSNTWSNTVDHLAELYGLSNYDQFQRDRSALIMWSGCLEGMDIVVDTPVYSLDILPTLSNLFGVEYDSRLLVGRDVFSDAQPLVLWPNYSWLTDKGTYHQGQFTPREGVTVSEDYVNSVTSAVKNKFSYSKGVVDMNYFNHLQNYMDSLSRE